MDRDMAEKKGQTDKLMDRTDGLMDIGTDSWTD